jgi:hypothetical protein
MWNITMEVMMETAVAVYQREHWFVSSVSEVRTACVYNDKQQEHE